MNDIAADLRRRVEGDVLFDDYTRTLYSTDASIYDITPIGVVLPTTEQDVVEVTRYAFEHGVPVLPRGSGSSLSGQAIGKAIILDFTRYLKGLVEVCPEGKWARVQAGLVYDELNRRLLPHRLKFGPDPASGSRAAMGGMIGNNSTGAHSIIYGMTADHIESLRVVLSNGDVATLRPMQIGSPELESASAKPGLESEILRGAVSLCRDYAYECEQRFPKMRRNVAGYNLRETVQERSIDLTRLLCGSEGTLATVLEAKIRVQELPKAKGIIALCFHDLIDSLRPVAAILEHGPSAVEVVDEMFLRLSKANKEHGATARSLPDKTGAVLLVEFYGESEAEIRPKLDAVRRLVTDQMHLAFHTMDALDVKLQEALWSLRKAGLPILLSQPGDPKPTAFVEDTAVSPESLPEYIAGFLKIVKQHGTTAAVYAHAGGGCLHIRPIVNIRKPAEVQGMFEMADEITDLVIRHGGTTSSEHGDGLVRSQWLKKLYGENLVTAFGKVKALFDPKGIMNPGKIVGDNFDLRQNLRYRDGAEIPEIKTALRFDSQIDLIRSVDMCNGCGTCRNLAGGVMCPSFRGAQTEVTSTRGRANLMRQALTGKLPHSELTSREFKEEVLDLCLGCKACKRECPSGVDLAKLKTEIKYQYLLEHGASLRDRLFGHIDRWSELGSALAPLVNLVNQSLFGRYLLEKLAGIDRRRKLPLFHWNTFVRWFHERRRVPHRSPRGKVAFYYDCYLNHNEPRIGKAAVEVLEGLGFDVVLANRQCCGRAMLSAGFIDDAREKALYNIRHLADQIRAGYAIVGCEPSCVATLQDDYRDMLRVPELELVEQNTFELMEFLSREEKKQSLELGRFEEKDSVLVHGHCHQKALGRAQSGPAVLKLLSGAEVKMLDSGCCGMAGAFGYEKSHYDLSMSIGELLFQQIRGHEGKVVAAGVSCRSQLEHGLGIRVYHPAEILREAMTSSVPGTGHGYRSEALPEPTALPRP